VTFKELLVLLYSSMQVNGRATPSHPSAPLHQVMPKNAVRGFFVNRFRLPSFLVFILIGAGLVFYGQSIDAGSTANVQVNPVISSPNPSPNLSPNPSINPSAVSASRSIPSPTPSASPLPVSAIASTERIESIQQSSAATTPASSTRLPEVSVAVKVPSPTASNLTASSSTASNPAAYAQTRYGHFPYGEAPPSELVTVSGENGRSEQLQVNAANAYTQMVQAARAEGISIVPISGFRDTVVQTDLFMAQTTRRGSELAAAKISAPPGYSEHHTGYAIDLGDGQSPDADLEISFDQTSAFQWLVRHANQFGFELSFPRNNIQGVSYEPWHWRFVGSQQSTQVFAQARSF
jgi:zinc D-Ala-D-Ala carboxypeptidase